MVPLLLLYYKICRPHTYARRARLDGGTFFRFTQAGADDLSECNYSVLR